MLDAQFIREQLDEVKTNCRNRNVQADVDGVVRLDDERKRILQETQVLQQRANEISKLIPKEKDAEKKESLRQEGRALRDQVTGLETKSRQVETELRTLLLAIPNMTHPDAPVGHTAADNKVLRRWGEPRKFDFAAKDHVGLAEAPDLARSEVLEGIGFMPRGPETQIYSVENTDLCLIATAEITLGGMHRDQTFDELQLPIKYVGLSHCFRTEAGAPGRDTRGLYRVHQFTKVEMFAFCAPDQSDALHQELLAIEEKVFQGLGLPYHVIDTCTGDLGGPA